MVIKPRMRYFLNKSMSFIALIVGRGSSRKSMAASPFPLAFMRLTWNEGMINPWSLSNFFLHLFIFYYQFFSSSLIFHKKLKLYKINKKSQGFKLIDQKHIVDIILKLGRRLFHRQIDHMFQQGFPLLHFGLPDLFIHLPLAHFHWTNRHIPNNRIFQVNIVRKDWFSCLFV